MGLRGPQPGTPRKGGNKKKPFNQRLIQFGVSVKGEHLTKARKEIFEIIKKYR